MGDIVLGLATELMTSFEFGPTFTGAFEVGAVGRVGIRPWSAAVHRSCWECCAAAASLPTADAQLSSAAVAALSRAPPPIRLDPSPSQVANKCVELLMLRQGYDVCCTSHSDRTAIERYEAQLSAGSS